MSGRRVIDLAFYESLLAAYLRLPGNASAAARDAGCDRRTAARAWSIGWPRKGFTAIKQRVEDEQRAARARLLRDDQDARQAKQDATRSIAEQAQLDSAKSRAEEARTVRASRANALALGSATARLNRGALALAKRIEAELLRDTDDAGNRKTLNVRAGVALLRQVAAINRESNDASRLAVQLERLVLGEPDTITGHVVINMTADDARREIERARDALARADARGSLPLSVVAGTDDAA
jgi:hypothetical protein